MADFLKDQLRDMCKARHLTSRGKKVELVQRLLGSRSRATDNQ